jgi:hypothetical protein
MIAFAERYITVALITVEGQVHIEEAPAENMLGYLQTAVDGYFGRIGGLMLEGCPVDFWFNEDGRMLKQPKNVLARVLINKAGRPEPFILGPVVLTGPPDSEGEITSLHPSLVEKLVVKQ